MPPDPLRHKLFLQCLQCYIRDVSLHWNLIKMKIVWFMLTQNECSLVFVGKGYMWAKLQNTCKHLGDDDVELINNKNNWLSQLGVSQMGAKISAFYSQTHNLLYRTKMTHTTSVGKW